MATINDLKKIETNTLQKILEACEKSFPKELNLEEFYGEGQTTWSIPEIGIVYKNTKSKNDLLNFVETLTDTKNIRYAYATIFEEVENRKSESKEAPRPEDQTRTTLSEDELKQFQEEQIALETKRKETILKSDKNVGEAIKRKKELYEIERIREEITKAKQTKQELIDKIIYARIETPEEPKLTEKEEKDLNLLRKLAKNSPQKLVEDMSQTIENKLIKSNIDNLPKDEIKIISKNTATEIVQRLANPEVINEISSQTAIFTNLANDNVIVPKIITKKTAQEGIKKAATTISAYRIIPNVIEREISKTVIGEKFTQVLFGPTPDQIKIEFFDKPTEDITHEINLEKLNDNYINIQENQNILLDTVSDFGKSEARSYVLNKVSTAIETKIASLPAESTIKSLYSTAEVRGILANYGLARPVTWESTNVFGKIVLDYFPEIAPIFSGLSKITGIGFGITSSYVAPIIFISEGSTTIAGVAAYEAATLTSLPIYGATTSFFSTEVGAGIITQATTQATTQAIAQTTTKVAGGLLPAIFASLSTVAGWITFGISTIVGFILGKLLEKVNWKKVKEYLLPLAAIGGGLLIGGPVGLTLIAGGGLVAAGAIRGGIGVGVFFARLGMAIGSISIRIATPVIITLLIIPPLVAFIMFVINSGAYLVPPSSLGSGADNPYMLVTKIAEPKKTSNPNPEIKVNYTVTITALKSTLTNIRVVSTKCTVIKKDKSVVKCPSEIIPDIDKDLIISPTKPYSFVFVSDYNSKYSDSIIYDSIEISADTPEEKGIITSGSATVCIGDCPTNCVKVSDNSQVWPSSLRSNSEVAVGTLVSQYQGFMAKVCSNNEEINLCYNPSQITPKYYAWHIHNSFKDNCDVYFNQKGVSNSGDALFLITHELTHHIQKINGSASSQYFSSGGYFELGGRGFCTYEDTAGGPKDTSAQAESMAEANGLYASIPSWGGCISNYASQYPKNYIFAQNFMR